MTRRNKASNMRKGNRPCLLAMAWKKKWLILKNDDKYEGGRMAWRGENDMMIWEDKWRRESKILTDQQMNNDEIIIDMWNISSKKHEEKQWKYVERMICMNNMKDNNGINIIWKWKYNK